MVYYWVDDEYINFYGIWIIMGSLEDFIIEQYFEMVVIMELVIIENEKVKICGGKFFKFIDFLLSGISVIIFVLEFKVGLNVFDQLNYNLYKGNNGEDMVMFFWEDEQFYCNLLSYEVYGKVLGVFGFKKVNFIYLLGKGFVYFMEEVEGWQFKVRVVDYMK